MRKVLIVAFAFPPADYIGALRPYKLAKYFPKNGWEPVVLTMKRPRREYDWVQVIEADQDDMITRIKRKIGYKAPESIAEARGSGGSKAHDRGLGVKLYELMRDLVYFPDPEKGWCNGAVNAATAYMKRENVDAIISTSSPATNHLVAKKLKQRHHVPWIADFRDPWSQNAYSNKHPIIKHLEKKLEIRTISSADAIVTVTEPWIKLLGSLHKGKRVHCVTNGYDEDDFAARSAILTNKFTITYAGSLYKGKRDPSPLFNVITNLINEGKINKDLIEVRFYGVMEDWLIEKVRKKKLDGVVKLHGRVPRDHVLNKLMESQLLLLLVWNNKNEEGFCPAKLYEYFGAKRPIIATGWAGSTIKGMIEETNTGRFVEDEAKLKNVIKDYYKEYIKRGAVEYHGNSKVMNYSYKSIANNYSDVLSKYV